MVFKSSKAFSLLEVLLSIVILSTAIVFIFRSFTSSLFSTKFSQNITLACFLAENKIWELEQEQKIKVEPIETRQDSEILQGKEFKWKCQVERLGNSSLIYLEFIISWQEGLRKKEYSLEFNTYILSR